MTMELKRADVALLVFLGLGETLLKLALLLESVLLAHHSLLLVGLHYATLRAEVAQLTVEDLILAELTFERTIIKRSLERRFEAYLLETLLAIAQYPCVAVEELVLESFANHLVCAQ